MYKKSIIHYVSKVTIDILLILSAICTIAIPFYYERIFNFMGYINNSYMATFTVIIFVSGVICTYILFVLRQMYKSLLVGNPFTDKNVSSLRKIAVCCIIIAIIYFAKLFIVFTFATLVICAIFVVGCLFCLTLKDLFKQAINYKAENELTI